MLPFTPEQFLAVFAEYNRAIWPAQIAAYLLGGTAVALLCYKPAQGDRVIAGILAAMWLWTGALYHGVFFSEINPAAYLFAALFVAQGAYLLYAGVYRRQVSFGLRWDLATAAGALFVLYAALVYPAFSAIAGHRYPELPTFGVTPCPVTLFTFGLLLVASPPVPRLLLVAPAAWSLIGGSAAILLDMPADWPLLIGGFVVAPLIALRDWRAARSPTAPHPRHASART